MDTPTREPSTSGGRDRPGCVGLPCPFPDDGERLAGLKGWLPKPGTTHFDLDRKLPTRFDLPLAGEEEIELMIQSSGWAKYGSTEFVSFVLIFTVATVGLFLGRLSAELWMISALCSAVITGTVRTVKSLKILGLEFEGFKCKCNESEPPE